MTIIARLSLVDGRGKDKTNTEQFCKESLQQIQLNTTARGNGNEDEDAKKYFSDVVVPSIIRCTSGSTENAQEEAENHMTNNIDDMVLTSVVVTPLPAQVNETVNFRDAFDSKSSSSSESESSSEYSGDSTLLDSWSEESTQEGMERLPSLYVRSKYEGLERLKKKLARRRKRLKKLCAGQPPAYVHLLEMNEEVAGKIKIAEYNKQYPGEVASNAIASVNGISPLLSQRHNITSWLGILQFEALHTLPCAYTVFIVCLGHSTFYGVLECLCRIFYKTIFKPWINQNMFDSSLIILGLFLLRFNGGLFFYSTTTMGYNRVKMEMSNRLRVGMIDARLLKRIKGSIFASSFNMFGYYLICIGISHLYEKLYYIWMGKHDAWFHSIWYRSVELANAEFLEKQKQWAEFSVLESIGGPPTIEEISPTCDVATSTMSSSVLKPFFNFWCRDTSYEYKSVELTFHGLWLLLSTGLAFRVGQNLMMGCD